MPSGWETVRLSAERKWLANDQNGAFDPVRPASWFETVKMRLLTTRILALWASDQPELRRIAASDGAF